LYYIVIEVIGGENPALDYVKKALASGKHVVTANKELISKHGPELFALADENKVDILYEASVGGGIPLTSSRICWRAASHRFRRL